MKVRLWRGSFDAVVLDLDGVLTRTAHVHAAAWKEMFDDYLRGRSAARGEAFVPFDADADYRRFVDGRPSEEGAACFLASRGIHLPPGTETDPPDRETVWGLGNRKRDRFLDLVTGHGVGVHEEAVAFARRARLSHVGTAVVSSSRDCRTILEAAALLPLFDVIVDGVERARCKLAGKPAPDTFLEAARRLGVDPRRAVVVEDAIAGVSAGRRGGFGCVVGIDPANQGAALRVAGADFTVRDLSEVVMVEDERGALRPTVSLPSALERLDELLALAGRRRLAVFLDYDGTLTPIVLRPQDARLPEEARRVLRCLAQSVPVTVVSGRDLRDVRDLVAVEGIFYAGSHGFEIAGVDGVRLDAGPGDRFLPALERAERDLREALGLIPGVVVERKRFAVAVHFRGASDEDVPRAAGIVDAVATRHRGLCRTEGKRVFELRPDIEWHKGTAVRHLMSVMGLPTGDGFPVYVGDDLTDEDAFLAIACDGLPIVVREEPRLTFARHALDNAGEVLRFLEALRRLVAGGGRP